MAHSHLWLSFIRWNSVVRGRYLSAEAHWEPQSPVVLLRLPRCRWLVGSSQACTGRSSPLMEWAALTASDCLSRMWNVCAQPPSELALSNRSHSPEKAARRRLNGRRRDLASIAQCLCLRVCAFQLFFLVRAGERLSIPGPLISHHPWTSTLRGRPRPLFWATTAPSTMISPPQTPQGSARSSAPARHDAAIGHCAHRALATAMMGACSANQSSGSSLRHGIRLSTRDVNLAPSSWESGLAGAGVTRAPAVRVVLVVPVVLVVLVTERVCGLECGTGALIVSTLSNVAAMRTC